jgi:LmbE family N-acetylglucosaminyl deacetylase
MGGLIARLTAEGHRVYVGALADGETSRHGADERDVRLRVECQHEAAKVLGCQVLNGANFSDQRLDAVDLLDLTRVIERWIAETKPEMVFTHSAGDLNADHRRVYEATLPAVRPKNGVRGAYAFAGPRMLRFEPTSFWSVTGHVETQLKAMRCYGRELDGEAEMVKARAVEYGYRVGVKYAEGFEVVRVCQ